MTDPTVRYHHTVVLGIPLGVDGHVYNEIDSQFSLAAPPELAAYAQRLGANPPTTEPGWLIGRQQSTCAHNNGTLVWWRPDKLDAIDSMVEAATQDDPELTDLTVMQGPGWDELFLVTGAPTGDAETVTDEP